MRSMMLVFGSLFASLFVIASAPAVARAEKFLDPKLYDAFERASAREGCDAMPYEAERKVCKSSYAKQEDACVEFSCNLKSAEKRVDQIEDLMREIKKFEDSRRPENQYSTDLRTKLKKLQGELAEQVEQAKPAAKQAVECREARVAVKSVFARTETRVREEKSYGNKWFEKWRTEIADGFKKAAPGHKIAIEGVNDAAENCKAVLRIDEKYYEPSR